MTIHDVRRSFWLAFLVLLAGLPALGSAKPVGSAPRHTAAAADPLAQRLCDGLHAIPEARMAQCCGRAPASSLAGECTRTLSAARREQRVRLDAAAVDRCVAETAKSLAGCDWVTPWMPRSPEACRGVVQGERQAGAACRSSLECKEDLFCRSGELGTGGLCSPPGAAGARCGGPVDDLASYTRQSDLNMRHPECAGYCLAGRCAAYVALGGACSSNRQCAPGRHCGGGRCGEGPLPALGDAPRPESLPLATSPTASAQE